MFRRYTLTFRIDPTEALDPAHQAALLTGVALARRVFLGGVAVASTVDVPLCVPMPLGSTLAQAITALGGSLAARSSNGPVVSIGGVARPRADGFHVRALFAGWRGGIVPGHWEAIPTAGGAMPLAAMLSAALAVNEAFLYSSREAEGGSAGRRAVGLSLWQPSSSVDWLGTCEEEPDLQYLPSQLWLIGLGHLGQAYLWGLGLLPYPNPPGLSLVLPGY